MIKYIIKRLFFLIPVVIGVVTLVFIVMRVCMPDPSLSALGKLATDEQRHDWRVQEGLEEPLHIQYFNFLRDVATGDLGRSYVTKEKVTTEVLKRFPATVELAVVAIVLASIFGILIGVISAIKKNSIFDNIGMMVALIGISVPIFWLGIIFIMTFSGSFIPTGSRIDPLLKPDGDITGFYLIDTLIQGDFETFVDAFRHMILPAMTLAMYSMSVIARMTRSSMLETLNQDYIRTARAKGLSEKKVIIKHALRNALIPITTVIGLQFGSLLAGAILTESIFTWPGIGKYTVDCISSSDFPVVQGVVIIVAIVFVFVNLLVDMLYALLDPRIQFTKERC